MSDTISKLKDLKELLDAGALTQDEFDAQKAVIGTRGARETFLRGRKGRAAKNSVLTSGVKQLKC